MGLRKRSNEFKVRWRLPINQEKRPQHETHLARYFGLGFPSLQVTQQHSTACCWVTLRERTRSPTATVPTVCWRTRHSWEINQRTYCRTQGLCPNHPQGHEQDSNSDSGSQQVQESGKDLRHECATAWAALLLLLLRVHALVPKGPVKCYTLMQHQD